MRLSLCFAVSAAWEESGLRFVLYLFDIRQFRGRAEIADPAVSGTSDPLAPDWHGFWANAKVAIGYFVDWQSWEFACQIPWAEWLVL
jgi:hypothetical protein